METKVRNENELVDVSSWLKAVQMAFKAGDYNEVMHGINKLLGDPNCDQLLVPNEKEALIWGVKGAAALREGQCQEAIDYFNQVLAIDLKNPMLSDLKNALAWHSKGFAFGAMGRWDEALHCFDQLLVIDPENVSALQHREKVFNKKLEAEREKIFEHSVHPAVILKRLEDNTLQTLRFSKLREIGEYVSLIQGHEVNGFSEDHFLALQIFEQISQYTYRIFSISCIAAVSNEQVVIGNVSHGTLSLWDLTHKTCLQTFKGHTDSVNCVAVTPKGQIVSGSRDKTIRLWNPANGMCLQTFQGHTDSVNYVAVTPKGQIVSRSRDKTVRLWDPASGKCLKTFLGHRDSNYCIGINSLEQIITVSYDGILKVWDLMQGTCLQTLQVNRDVRCLAVLPNRQVVVGYFGQYQKSNLEVWDLAERICVKTLNTSGYIYDLAVLSNKYVVVSTSRDLEFWDLENCVCLNGSNDRDPYIYI